MKEILIKLKIIGLDQGFLKGMGFFRKPFRYKL